MYGKNVETWIKYISDLQERCYEGTQIIIKSTETEDGQRPKMIPHWHDWPTTIFQTQSADCNDGSHSHGISVDQTSTERTNGPENKIWEEANPCPISSFFPQIKTAFTKIKNELPNVKTIDNKLYVNKFQMHNSVGSPYTELYAIDSTFIHMEQYANSHSQLNYIGEKMTMFFYLQTMITRLTDAKVMIIIYFDNIQRGYDSLVNGGKPSITWDEFDIR